MVTISLRDEAPYVPAFLPSLELAESRSTLPRKGAEISLFATVLSDLITSVAAWS